MIAYTDCKRKMTSNCDGRTLTIGGGTHCQHIPNCYRGRQSVVDPLPVAAL